nr:zinc finger protein 33B-like isoform X2 [Leptinotarsa decemlineata]
MDTGNYSNLCRACLCSSNDLKSLHDSIDLFITFEHITCLQIEEGEEMPQNICLKCALKLEDITKFIRICKASDSYIRQRLTEKDNIEICDSSIEDDIANDYDSQSVIEMNSSSVLDSKPEEAVIVPLTEKNKLDRKSYKSSKKTRSEECSCDTCGKKFTRLGGLQRHMKIHLGIKPFKCTTCCKTFSQKATLERHYLTHTEMLVFPFIVHTLSEPY